MKLLLVSAVLVFSTIASASTINFKEGDKGLTLLSEGKVSVESYMPNCPKPAMCEPAAILKIQFTLGGCMDKLGPVTITEVGQSADGKRQFLVTAYNVNNEASTYTKCFRAPVGIATKVIGMGFLGNDSVEVKFTEATVKSETF